MKKSNFNLTIASEDDSLNDFVYTWSELGVRPSKTNILGYFKPEIFMNFLSGFELAEIYVTVDVIPNQDVTVINQKNFVILDNELFLSYTHLDKEHDESIISDVYLLHNTSFKEKVDNFVDKLTKMSIISDETQTEQENSKTLSILNLNQNGFELEHFESKKDFEDIEYYYEENTIKSVKKIIKALNKEKKGLTILSGERGCGKTNLLAYISEKVDKNCIFLPCNLLENSLSNPDFRKFMTTNKNSVLIIDDSELFFSQMYSKSTFFSTNLLQLVESMYSDVMNLNIVLSMNCSVTEIDKSILESNEIIDVVQLGKLSSEKVEELCNYLDKKNKFKSPVKLVDVLKNKYKSDKSELGFK